MIDLHAHILPGLDDGARNWAEALDMARLAVADGIRVMVATPHLFPHRITSGEEILAKEKILETLIHFKQKLRQAEIALEILPGCDVPLCAELEEYLEEERVLTINDGKRYLLLELPDTALPPAIEEFCFRLISRGLTPILTHPERHFLLQQTPEKLARLIHLGCLAQVTAQSLLGGFGRRAARASQQMIRAGYVQVIASDAHNTHSRPPLLQAALQKAAVLIGAERAGAMVTTIPEKIVRGEPCLN